MAKFNPRKIEAHKLRDTAIGIEYTCGYASKLYFLKLNQWKIFERSVNTALSDFCILLLPLSRLQLILLVHAIIYRSSATTWFNTSHTTFYEFCGSVGSVFVLRIFVAAVTPRVPDKALLTSWSTAVSNIIAEGFTSSTWKSSRYTQLRYQVEPSPQCRLDGRNHTTHVQIVS